MEKFKSRAIKLTKASLYAIIVVCAVGVFLTSIDYNGHIDAYINTPSLPKDQAKAKAILEAYYYKYKTSIVMEIMIAGFSVLGLRALNKTT